ncbi:MAG: hypothetical protein NTZ01_03550 [Verrucomicrobia bacterium]|nr:hypothetical protein [Verrucomicrobiota bacterium]
MSPISIRARQVNGHIETDIPMQIPSGSELVLTIYPPDRDTHFQNDWGATARASLSRAYGPSEPDYTERDIRD